MSLLRCPPLAGCEAADLPYCVMLGTPCQGTGQDHNARSSRSLASLRMAYPHLADWVLLFKLTEMELAQRCTFRFRECQDAPSPRDVLRDQLVAERTRAERMARSFTVLQRASRCPAIVGREETPLSIMVGCVADEALNPSEQ